MFKVNRYKEEQITQYDEAETERGREKKTDKKTRVCACMSELRRGV